MKLTNPCNPEQNWEDKDSDFIAQPDFGYIVSGKNIKISLSSDAYSGKFIKIQGNSNESENSWEIIPQENQAIFIRSSEDTIKITNTGRLFSTSYGSYIDLVCLDKNGNWDVGNYINIEAELIRD